MSVPSMNLVPFGESSKQLVTDHHHSLTQSFLLEILRKAIQKY